MPAWKRRWRCSIKTLSGKVALVTGASRGIGREIAVTLAEAGADVFITYNANPADGVLAAIRAHGVRGEQAQLNVTDGARCDAVVKECTEKLGGVDILVNNAGITKDGLLMRMKDADWDEVLDTNLKGAFNMTRAVSRPMMKKHAGRIINIGSVVGAIGNAGQANYAASKAGQEGLTKAVAKELASRNILVNLIAPGYIVTEMTDVLGDDVKKAVLEGIPVKRFGSTRDVANAVVFLASGAADYITGQVLHVNGGMYM